MAAITNAQAVVFCNGKARVLADLIERTRRTAQQFAIDVVTEFEANTSSNVDGDVIVDGSAEDGRGVIQRHNIAELKYVAEQLVAALTQDDRAALVAAVSVNGQPSF